MVLSYTHTEVNMCPIYELSCENCPKITEVMCHYEEYIATTYTCTMCHKELNKQLSKTTFRLYGDGFYSPTRKEKD